MITNLEIEAELLQRQRATVFNRLKCYLHKSHQKLEAEHSIECITDADNSIAFNKTVLHVVSLCDETAVQDRLVVQRANDTSDDTTVTRWCHMAISSRGYALCDPVTLSFGLLT